MARGQVTWGQLVEICQSHNIDVYRGKGGRRKLKGPGADGGTRSMVIGRKCCTGKNDTVYTDYVKAFQRRFGIDDDELWPR